jgi:preprotein translocase subunit SecD
MNLKTVLQDVDPVRHDSSLPDADRVRMRVMSAAREADARPRTHSRRALLAAAAAAIALAVVGGSQLLTQAAVRFEVRLAEDQPAAGLQAARIPNSDRTIYLHRDVLVTNSDIADSRIVPGSKPDTFWIDVKLTTDGARKMHDATAAHIGKPVAILLDGDVVMAPTVRSALGDAAVINGDFTRAQAERIVNGMSLAR